MKRILSTVLGLSFMASMALGQSKQADYLAALEVLNTDDMRSAITKATEHGLNVKDYWPDSLEAQYLQGANPQLKEQVKAAYLKLLQHLNAGSINPENLGKDFEIKKKSFVDLTQFNVMLMVAGSNAKNLVQGFSPQNPPYRGLQEALRRVSSMCDQGQWTAIPAVKKPLKLGSNDAILPAIKTSLRQLGYNIATIDNVYDQQTLAAVNDIQTMLHFRPDGVISPDGKTWKYLNTSCTSRLDQIRLDLEKLRWFPRDFGDRYIYVNLAMTYLNLMDKDNGTAMVMKTINGRTARKTPTMVDKITYITVNPYWVVPPTVFREDKLQDLKNLSPWDVENYFYKGNYQVWNRNFTKQYQPSYINWQAVTNDSDIYIRQQPGLHNALGVLKFMMTNDIAIYLHDTNQRELFGEYERQLSSGCVRVEKPFDLAEKLLIGTKWDRRMLEAKTAKPYEVPSTDTNVSLAKAMPVYMVFQTSQLSSDGILRFAEDSYGQGARMKARK